MITGFENITHELTEEELTLIPVLVAGFKRRTKDNPIKAPQIVKLVNEFMQGKGSKVKLSEPRLRKCVNHIRTNGLLPLIATSHGYYVSTDPQEIKSQIQSLYERASSIRRCADGMASLIAVNNL